MQSGNLSDAGFHQSHMFFQRDFAAVGILFQFFHIIFQKLDSCFTTIEHVDSSLQIGLHCFLFQNDLLLRNQFFVLVIKQIPHPRTSHDNDEKNEKY